MGHWHPDSALWWLSSLCVVSIAFGISTQVLCLDLGFWRHVRALVGLGAPGSKSQGKAAYEPGACSSLPLHAKCDSKESPKTMS